MSSQFRLDMTVNDNAGGVLAHLLPSRKSPAMILDAIARYFDKMAGGMVSSSTHLVTTAVAAAGTVTFSSFTTGDTVTVGATTLTGSNGAPGDQDHFDVSGNDASDATNFAACVNAHTVLSKYLSAAKTGAATVTLTSLVPGVIGNAIALAISAHGSVVAFASGSEDTPYTIGHGI